MKLTKMMFALLVAAGIAFTSCKPKDADIKSAIETKIKASPELSGTMVDVKDGVATISGELKSAADKMKVADLQKDVKGLKTFVDNTTVAEPIVVTPTAPVEISADDLLMKNVTDAIKDFPGITATVKDGVIAVAGELSADKWKKLKMALDGLRPKKVDASSLKIK